MSACDRHAQPGQRVLLALGRKPAARGAGQMAGVQPDVLVLNGPTVGVDIAQACIHAILQSLRTRAWPSSSSRTTCRRCVNCSSLMVLRKPRGGDAYASESTELTCFPICSISAPPPGQPRPRLLPEDYIAENSRILSQRTKRISP